MGKYSAARDLDLSVKTRWYVVANRVEAVLYRDRPEHPFEFVERLSNPKGRLTEAELDSDRPGRSFSSAPGSTVRHGLDQRHVHHEQAAVQFAHHIGQVLWHALLDHQFARLVIVAEPHFLGLIRQSLPEQVTRLIEHEIPREFHEGSDAELRDYILRKIQTPPP